jgi:DegV family protein with EDD domain
MSKIAIVTDSSAYIPKILAEKYPIFTIPLLLLWGEKTLKDGVDILPEDFYAQMKSSPIIPTTSQPSPKDFIDMYKNLLDQGYDIFSIHLAQKLSGTLDSARQARQMLSSERIVIFDSQMASMALGFQVLTVARAIAAGADLKQCQEIADKAKERSGVYFIVSNLEYLRRGGRIGGAAALLGTMLNLKPVLTIRDGQIEAVEKVRTMSRAIDRMLDLFEADLNRWGKPVHISSLSSDNQDVAQILIDRAKQRFGKFQIEDACTASISPAIGCHVGPGVLGLCYLSGM